MELEFEPWNLTASQVCPKSMGEHPVGVGGAPSTGTSGQECSKEPAASHVSFGVIKEGVVSL